MKNQITVTMPIEEYETLKWIKKSRENLIYDIKNCIEIQHEGEGEAEKINLFIRTNHVVKLLAPYNNYDFELEHFNKVILEPYNGGANL